MSSRVPTADAADNKLSDDVIGNKSDAAAKVVGTAKSIVAYLKGLLSFQIPIEATGTADIDISAGDYTGFLTLLTITPAAGSSLADVVIDLDWNKATTGFDTVATAADTLDVVCVSKVDGTNWRTIATGTQVTANGDGSLEDHESGQRFKLGMIGVNGAVKVMVKISAEHDDVEIPYRVMYRGPAAPTITPVAAG